MNWFEKMMGAEKGVMPKWHGCLTYFIAAWTYYGIMSYFCPALTLTDAFLLFALGLLTEQLMNAIYGWKHDVFVHPETGRNLFFFHLASLVPFMVLFWMNCPIWAIALLFFTCMNDGRKYRKPDPVQQAIANLE